MICVGSLLLACVPFAAATQSGSNAYFSHKGGNYNIDGLDKNGVTFTGYALDSVPVDDSGSGLVDAGGRKMDPPKTTQTTQGPDPTESGDWENYWPSFGGKHKIKMNPDSIVRAGNGKVLDKAWYHLSNRPAPTVTETQTQFRFEEVFITSSVEPTEGVWCDGGWVQITKDGDLMDDEWTVAYITGFLNIIGGQVDGVETYDWCYNTKNRNNTGACAYQNAASHNPEDITAAFNQASDDGTSYIVMYVCNRVCLEAICQGVQSSHKALNAGLRLRDVVISPIQGSERAGVSDECLSGEGIYAPSNGMGGKSFRFCPQTESAQVCILGQDNGVGLYNFGDPACVCQSCDDLEDCLRPRCLAEQEVRPQLVVWELATECAACKQGFYPNPLGGVCLPCTNPDQRCRDESLVCTGEFDSQCAYGEQSCVQDFVNSAAPGGAGVCYCPLSGGCAEPADDFLGGAPLLPIPPNEFKQVTGPDGGVELVGLLDEGPETIQVRNKKIDILLGLKYEEQYCDVHAYTTIDTKIKWGEKNCEWADQKGILRAAPICTKYLRGKSLLTSTYGVSKELMMDRFRVFMSKQKIKTGESTIEPFTSVPSKYSYSYTTGSSETTTWSVTVTLSATLKWFSAAVSGSWETSYTTSKEETRSKEVTLNEAASTAILVGAYDDAVILRFKEGFWMDLKTRKGYARRIRFDPKLKANTGTTIEVPASRPADFVDFVYFRYCDCDVHNWRTEGCGLCTKE